MKSELHVCQLAASAGQPSKNLPQQTPEDVPQDYQPQLFWLSCSYMEHESQFLSEYQTLHSQHSPRMAFAVGGRALTDPLRVKMNYSGFCDNMRPWILFCKRWTS